MTIGRKLWLGFGTLVLILLATGLVAGVGGRAEQRLLAELVSVEKPVDDAAHEMEINAIGTGLGILQYVSTGDPAYRERVADDEADFERFEAVHDRLSETREEREAGDRLRSLYDEYRALGDDLMADKDRQSALTARLEEGYSELDAILDAGIQANVDRETPDGLEKAEAANAMEVQVAEIGTWSGMYLSDPKEEYRERVSDNVADFDRELNRFAGLDLTEEERRRAGELRTEFDRAEATVGERLALEDSRREGIGRFQELRKEIDGVLDENLQISARQDFLQTEAEVRATLWRVYVATMVLLLAGLLCGSGAASLISRSIVGGVRRLTDGANRFAEGALEHRVKATGDDELGELAAALNAMAERRQRVEEELRLREGAIAESDNGVAIADPNQPDYPVVYVNRAFEEMTGYPAEEAIGQNCRFLQGGDRDQAALEEVRASIREGRRCKVVLRNYRKNGEPFWNELSLFPVRDEEGRLVSFVGLQNDVTERKELEERLAHRAFHDPLTGLPDRLLLAKRLEQAIAREGRRGGSVAVLFIDLDGFKTVNDGFGHETGDRLLVAVAGWLGEVLRDGDTLARFGGDEFILLVEDAGGKAGAARVAERVAAALDRPIALSGGREVRISASIGIAMSSPGATAEELLRRADRAMYRAKARGKAKYEIYADDT